MSAIQIPTEAWRKNFRSVVLLAILGVCSAVAWVMAWHKSTPARNAREILSVVRRRGLKSYWPESVRRQQWFLIRRGETIVGWEMEYHQAGPSRAGGGFERRMKIDTGQLRLSARWRLSNNVEDGEYQSQRVVLSPPRAEVGEAKIVFHGRNLQVYQNINGVRYSSTATAPENYLPEGAMPLVIREVARRRGRARFEMVQDESHPKLLQGGRTPLFPFELRYCGEDSQTPGAMVETSDSRGNSWITVVDDNGAVVRRYGENLECTLVSYEEVLRHFPGVAEFASDEDTVEL
jgi:hypothetical protein